MRRRQLSSLSVKGKPPGVFPLFLRGIKVYWRPCAGKVPCLLQVFNVATEIRPPTATMRAHRARWLSPASADSCGTGRSLWRELHVVERRDRRAAEADARATRRNKRPDNRQCQL